MINAAKLNDSYSNVIKLCGKVFSSSKSLNASFGMNIMNNNNNKQDNINNHIDIINNNSINLLNTKTVKLPNMNINDISQFYFAKFFLNLEII